MRFEKGTSFVQNLCRRKVEYLASIIMGWWYSDGVEDLKVGGSNWKEVSGVAKSLNLFNGNNSCYGYDKGCTAAFDSGEVDLFVDRR